MATKRAKVNKTLEKAKKLVSKKGKKKTNKGTWPEGQARPQSKAYDIENDKTVPAKRTGYRFTKEGAKKLGKKPNDRPTAEEIEKYRNETFKVKGKVNKSGPKGVGDGSFRYLYIESRADKSDLNKARKLELGGINPDEMLNLKVFVDVTEDDYEVGQLDLVNSYTVDWLKNPNVEAKNLVKYLADELYLSDNPNDYSIDDDGIIHTTQLQDADGVHVHSGDNETMDRWKKGEEKLYYADYFIKVEAVKKRNPSPQELSKATGISDFYAKGGKTKKFLTYYEIYDENTDKTLNIQAYSFEEAEEIASTIEFDNFKDDEDIEYGEMAKGGELYFISDDGYELNISDDDLRKETIKYFKKSMSQKDLNKLGTSKYNSFIHHLIKIGYEKNKMAKGGETNKKSYAIIYFPNDKKIKKLGYESAYKAFSDYENEGSIKAELYENNIRVSSYPSESSR